MINYIKNLDYYKIKKIIKFPLIYFPLIYILICLMFHVKQANASSLSMPDAYLTINRLQLPVGLNNGTNYSIEFAVPEEKYIFGIVEICSQGKYNEIKISNTACNDSCITDGVVTVYMDGKSCSIGNYSGSHGYLQFKVNRFRLDPESTYFRAISLIQVPGYPYASSTSFLNFYASDTDELSALAAGQLNTNQIINKINEINANFANVTNSINNAKDSITQKQQETNKKLDDMNAKQQETNKKLDDMNAKQQETNKKLDDLNDTMTDDSIDNNKINSTFNSWADKNGAYTTLSDFVLLPVTMVRAYLNGMNSSCSSFNIGNLYGTNISFPCINLQNILGSELLLVIDILCGGFIILNLSKRFVKIFNDFTNLRDNQIDELYGDGVIHLG